MQIEDEQANVHSSTQYADLQVPPRPKNWLEGCGKCS